MQYSLWLDGHSSEEALRFVRTALEASVSKTKAKGELGGAGLEGEEGAAAAAAAEELVALLRRLAAEP